MYSVHVYAFPCMLFWLILMYSHSSAGRNQSEEKGSVTPSFSLSHCNRILEKTDQEMYFWTQLSIASLLTRVMLIVILNAVVDFRLIFCGDTNVSYFFRNQQILIFLRVFAELVSDR